MKETALIIAMALLLFVKGAEAAEQGEKLVKIILTTQDKKIEAVLNETAPAKDLLNRLPLSLNLYQHQAREYYAEIKLDKNDSTQNSYRVGDIAYWTPGNNLVLFYGKGQTNSLIKMGTITHGLEQLSKMGSSIQIRIEKDVN